MRDPNRPQPIHPADCACPRCDPQLAGRRRFYLEHALIGLVVTASCVAAAIAVFGLTN